MSKEVEIEKEIRTAYEGILSEEQILTTIAWWNEKAVRLQASVREELKAELSNEYVGEVHCPKHVACLECAVLVRAALLSTLTKKV